MAYSKCHSNIGFVNDSTPAISATNLNYMDGCIDTLDDRIVAMDVDKVSQGQMSEYMKSVTYTKTTKQLTCTYDTTEETVDLTDGIIFVEAGDTSGDSPINIDVEGGEYVIDIDDSTSPIFTFKPVNAHGFIKFLGDFQLEVYIDTSTLTTTPYTAGDDLYEAEPNNNECWEFTSRYYTVPSASGNVAYYMLCFKNMGSEFSPYSSAT